VRKYLKHPRLAAKLLEAGIKIDAQSALQLSDREVKALLEDIRSALATNQSDKMLNAFVSNGVETYEKVMSRFYDCTGLASNLRKFDDFNDLMDEISVEMVLPKLPLHFRLMICIAQATIAQHEINRILQSGAYRVKDNLTESTAPAVKPEVQNTDRPLSAVLKDIEEGTDSESEEKNID
jgi:hypothetical protein